MAEIREQTSLSDIHSIPTRIDSKLIDNSASNLEKIHLNLKQNHVTLKIDKSESFKHEFFLIFNTPKKPIDM